MFKCPNAFGTSVAHKIPDYSAADRLVVVMICWSKAKPVACFPVPYLGTCGWVGKYVSFSM